MELLGSREDVEVVISSRTKSQREFLQAEYLRGTNSKSNFRIPDHALDGLNLLYHSDLVIGGGGTMNREAAALSVPVASIFKGPLGAVDESLVKQNRMCIIDKAEDILPLLKKRIKILPSLTGSTARET